MIGQERSLLRTIEERGNKFVGHIIRKGGVEELSLSEKLLSSRGRGRQRKIFLENFNEAPGDLGYG